MTQTAATTMVGARGGDATWLSYEDYLQDESIDPHTEWVDGRVVPIPMVTDKHDQATVWLITVLKMYVEVKDLGEIKAEPFQMKTGPDLPGRAPDVMFIAKASLPRKHARGLQGPADLAIEVVSPTSRGTDTGSKYGEYERGGVPEYWIVDPERREAQFFQRDGTGTYRRVLPDDEGIYRSHAMPDLWLREAWLWEPPKLMDVMRVWELV